MVILKTIGPAHVVKAPISMRPVPFAPEVNSEVGTVRMHALCVDTRRMIAATDLRYLDDRVYLGDATSAVAGLTLLDGERAR